jgi:hypothetical protein
MLDGKINTTKVISALADGANPDFEDGVVAEPRMD